MGLEIRVAPLAAALMDFVCNKDYKELRSQQRINIWLSALQPLRTEGQHIIARLNLHQRQRMSLVDAVSLKIHVRPLAVVNRMLLICINNSHDTR